MIRAKTRHEDGAPMLIVGLTAKEVGWLADGKTVVVDTLRLAMPRVLLCLCSQDGGQLAVPHPAGVPVIALNLDPPTMARMLDGESTIQLAFHHLSAGPLHVLVYGARDDHAAAEMLAPYITPSTRVEDR